MAHTTETFVRDADSGDEGEDSSWDLIRTFVVPAESVDRMRNIGRTLSEELIEEEFYDRDDYLLSLRGLVLSNHGGNWTLSFDEVGKDRKASVQTLSSPSDILSFLHSRNIDIGIKGGTFGKEQLSEAGFKVFHRVSFTRKVFGIPGEKDLLPAKISLDINRFGFNFGTVEVSVDDHDSAAAALRTVGQLARNLGFEELCTARGLEKYCGVR